MGGQIVATGTNRKLWAITISLSASVIVLSSFRFIHITVVTVSVTGYCVIWHGSVSAHTNLSNINMRVLALVPQVGMILCMHRKLCATHVKYGFALVFYRNIC